MSPEAFFRDLLAKADIAIGGDRPWDIQVRDPRTYTRIMRDGSIGFGEAYMEGWLDCDRLDEMTARAFRADLSSKIAVRTAIIQALKVRLSPYGSRQRSFEVGTTHYDTGNDLFELMLDPYMVYSCGYWRRANNLDGAQRDKLELICRKLQLEPGQKLLDIGCGFGSFARYAAEHYGVSVVGLSVSREQIALASEKCKGLPIEFRFTDYRDVKETFDKIVSIGMVEHVGRRYYDEYFATIARCLKSGGLALVHTIGQQGEDPINAWYDKYVMPGMEFPTFANFADAAGPDLVIEDFQKWEGSHYDKTLMAWFERFNRNWEALRAKYGDTFYRMWKLYLQGCAGAFRVGKMCVWQFVFSKGGLEGGYGFGHPYPLD